MDPSGAPDDSDTSSSSSQGSSGTEASPGRRRSPILVPLLSYLTLQLYLYYWVWKTGESVEGFDRYRDSPYEFARWGVPLSVAGSLLVGAAILALLLLEPTLPTNPSPARLAAPLLALIILLVMGGLLTLTGMVLLWVAYWRIWQFVSTHEANLGYEPLNASLMLVLWVGGLVVVGLIPIVGWAIQLGARVYVLYRTQRGLNRVWEAAGQGYEAPEPRFGYGAAPRHPEPQAAGTTPGGLPPNPQRPRPHAREVPAPESTSGQTVPYTCPACGNREQIPARRPLRVVCPACEESEVLE